jgi:transcriptional regulator of arginine metabolism
VNNEAAGAALHRRNEILRIVSEEPVRSQEELAERLAKRGYRVAQPTLSRDLKDLAIVKLPGGYAPAPGLGDAPRVRSREEREERLDRVLREFALSVEVAGTLVVVRTPPADAHPLARAIDEAGLPGVAGTIAGDDTIFLAAKGAAAAADVARRLLRPVAPRPPGRPSRARRPHA